MGRAGIWALSAAGGKGQTGGGLGERGARWPPQQARGRELVPLPSQSTSSGVRRGEDGRPPGATFVCPGHQAPSGHSAERTVSVTSLLLENRVAS